jgi:hypothetical protein
MHGVCVGSRMHDNSLDAEFLAGAQHAQRDLAAIGYEDFRNMPLLDHHQRFPIFDGLGVLEQDRLDRAGARRGIWFIVFMASMMRSVWPSLMVWPTSMKGFEPGEGEIGSTDHRRGHGILGQIGGGCGHRSGGRRLRRNGNRHWRGKCLNGGSAARHANLQITEFHFDLGQVRVVQDTRQIANQLLVDVGLFRCHFKAF